MTFTSIDRARKYELDVSRELTMVGYFQEYLQMIKNYCSICLLVYGRVESHPECIYLEDSYCSCCFDAHTNHQTGEFDRHCRHASNRFPSKFCFECGLPALVGIENIRLHPLIEGRENDLREINFGRGCNSGARDKILPVLYFLKHMKSPIIPDLELPFSDWKIKIISTNLHIKIITGLYQRFLTRQRIGMTN